MNATNPPSRRRVKGQTRLRTPGKRTLTKRKPKKKSPVCPLHGPGHDMNSCKFMLAQAKSMKSTCLTAHSGGAGRVRFQGAKKPLAKGKKLNNHVANAVKAVITTNKHKKYKASSDSGSEDKQEHFNFETLKIGGK